MFVLGSEASGSAASLISLSEWISHAWGSSSDNIYSFDSTPQAWLRSSQKKEEVHFTASCKDTGLAPLLTPWQDVQGREKGVVNIRPSEIVMVGVDESATGCAGLHGSGHGRGQQQSRRQHPSLLVGMERDAQGPFPWKGG